MRVPVPAGRGRRPAGATSAARLLALAAALVAGAAAGGPGTAQARPEAWVYDHLAGRVLPAPEGYVVERTLTVRGALGGLKSPQDLFLDPQGYLWVVDSGNARVLKMTRRGEVAAVLQPPAPERLHQPQGVFVAPDGRVYVADTGNGRIAVFDGAGKWLRSLGAPRSELIEPGFAFKPSKLLIDRRGYLNVVNEGDYRGILLMDLEGGFRGYFATNPVGFDWRRLLLRVLATRAQRERIGRVLPAPHSNLDQDDQGFVYTTTVHTSSGQIKRFNSIGRNTYPVRSYGLPGYRDMQQVLPHFTDLAVDATGIVTVVDASFQLVYQFDQDRHNLIIFGGRGEQQGRFVYPSAIEVDEQGRLFVADREQGVIHVFRPTEFMQLVHRASALYYDGRYEEAGEPWRQVLRLDRNYPIAHRGLGRALLKQGRLEQALEEFRLGKDRPGYSRAFGELRYRWMREHFGLTVLALAGSLVGVWLALRLAGRVILAARRHYGGYA